MFSQPLDGSHIHSYTELYKMLCELYLVIECIFASDKLFEMGIGKRVKDFIKSIFINCVDFL